MEEFGYFVSSPPSPFACRTLSFVDQPNKQKQKKQVSTTGLPTGQPYSQEEYGSDLTYYVATSAADEPAAVTTPSST